MLEAGGPILNPQDDTPASLPPAVQVLSACLVGLCLGHWLGSVVGFLLLALLMLGYARWLSSFKPFRGSSQSLWVMTLAGLLALNAGWAGLIGQIRPRGPDITAFMQPEGHLAIVQAVALSKPQFIPSDESAFAKFGHRPPSTRLILRVEKVWVDSGPVPATGRLVLTTRGIDARLAKGQTIQASGWLLPPAEPDNPGQEGQAQSLARIDVFARLVVRQPGNIQIIKYPADGPDDLPFRAKLRGMADRALMLHVDPETDAGRLIRALLLGLRDDKLYKIGEPYRNTGLFHLLSISGAHLSILLGMVWVISRTLLPRPAHAVWLVLAVLGCYLLILPDEVPIVRASIMAIGLCLGDLFARRVGSTIGFLFSAWLILIFKPAEMSNIGFQLSYIGVASLLWLTRPVAHVLGLESTSNKGGGKVSTNVAIWRQTRSVVGLAICANIAAWLGTLPVLAFHFGMVNPLGWFWSLLSAPLVTLLLGLAFLKMTIGLLFPTVSMLLAGPVVFLADLMHMAVGWAGSVAGSVVHLTDLPSVLWLMGCGLVLAALGSGWFENRRFRLAGSVGFLALWLVVPQMQTTRNLVDRFAGDKPYKWDAAPNGAALEVASISVGDGSCLYLRSWDKNGKPGSVLMFDCGSMSIPNLARSTIAPTLKTLGINRIDTLVVSHPDLDHFSGVLDLADRVPISQVFVTRYLVNDARQKPHGSQAVLLAGLGLRNIPVWLVTRGDVINLPGITARALWPVPGLEGWPSNDGSAVLKITQSGRAVLLSGDIQDRAIRALELLGEDLRADIAELPHHGGFVSRSGEWLVDVSPKVAIQSSGRERLIDDPWPNFLSITNTTRLATGRDGFVRVWVLNDGVMLPEKFRTIHTNAQKPDEDF